MAEQRIDRRNRRQGVGVDAQRAYSDGALALVQMPSALPFQYRPEVPGDSGPIPARLDPIILGEFTAAGADPNTSAPTVAETICGADVSHLGLYPFWSSAQACKVGVWVDSGVVAAGVPRWVRVAVVSFAGNGEDVETAVPIGYRDAVVRPLSGVDAGHALSLLVAVC